MKSALFFRFEENLRQVYDFEKFDPEKYDLGKTSCAWPETSVLYNFHEKRTVLERIWGQCDDFDNFDALKCDFAKTCCAWPERSVLYNFHGKRTVFPFWRAFQASVTILTTLTLKNAIWPKRAAHDLKRAFCTIFMKSALFPRFGENLRPVWRFWQLWRSKMRFGQNVLRMTWNERFVQFSWKAHCFPVLERIWGQCDDFDNFDALKCDLAKTCCAWPETSVLYNFHEKRTVSPFWENFRPVWRFWQLWRSKCDLAKTCCAWPEKSVLYNFHEKRTVFPFWREFQASVTILTTLTLKNAIWPKRAAHDLKRAFCTIFMESALFSRIWDKSSDFEKFDPEKYDLAKTCCAWPETSVLYNFHKKRTFFPFWRAFQASVTILTTLTLTNAIWPKRAAHDLKRAFCTIFMKSALFPRFGENLRPVWRFWQLWRFKMRFGQNVLRMTWNERFVQFSWKAHSFPVLERIWGQCDDFDNFDALKCDFAKTCCAWPERSVLYNFHKKRTLFPIWRAFQASVTILTTLTLKNVIWPKRAAHDLKRSFCTIFMKRAPFPRFGENLRPVWRFWQLWRSKMRFGQNVLRMTWKERFVQFSWKAHCFPVLPVWDFGNFELKNAFWPKVLRMTWFWWTVFPFWRDRPDDFDNFDA